MDKSAIALWRATGNESRLFSVLVSLALCLTGCETLQPAASNAYHPPPASSPGNTTHPVAATTTPAPPAAQTSPPPVEKPLRPPEPQRPPPQPAHAVEPKPAPIVAPPKGAETLVALSAPAQARGNQPASAPQKTGSVSTSKKEDPATSTADVPQALYFKGPERPPASASHKLLWLGLGLGLCGAAGGGLTWAQVSRRRKVTEAIPAKKQPEDEIRLPREFKMKEPRVFVDEPVTTDKD